MANTTIEIKVSQVSGNTPSSLANGEISINTADGKLFYKAPSGTITPFAKYPGPAGLNGEIQFNDSGVLGSTANLSINKTTGALTVGGSVTTNAFVQFSDGSRQYTANAGAGGSAVTSVAGATGAISNTQLINAVTSPSQITFNSIVTSNNGQGTNFRIGDDAWLGDVNVADTVRLAGLQNSANAWLRFGSTSTEALGRAGAGPLLWGANTIWHSGNQGIGSGLDADLLDGLTGTSYANSTFAQAGFTAANTAQTTATAGFAAANTAQTSASAAFNAANTAQTTATAGFTAANTAQTTAAAAFNAANTAQTTATNALSNTVQVLTVNSATRVVIANTTATTSNVTGALVVAGGIATQGNIYSTGGTLVINNGLATTGNSGTIVLGDGTFTKTYGGSWTFGGGVASTGAGFTAPNSPGLTYTGYTFSGTGQSIYQPTPGVVGITANSANAFTVSAPSGGVNFVQVSGNTTGNAVTIGAGGADANVDVSIIPKGSAGKVNIPSTVASTSNITGALVVSGGLGVSGDIYAGNLNTGPGQYINFGGSTGTRIYRDGGLNGMSLQTASTSRLFISDSGPITVTGTTAATSNTTGALIVSGGLGVVGNVYTGNHIITGSTSNGITFVDGTIQTTAAFGAVIEANTLVSKILANTVYTIGNSRSYTLTTGGKTFMDVYVDGYKLVRNLDYTENTTTAIVTSISIPIGSMIEFRIEK